MRKFLWTAGIAVGVFGICLGLFWVIPGLRDAESGFGYYAGGVVYHTAFYLAPLAFLVGAVGSLVCLFRSHRAKTKPS